MDIRRETGNGIRDIMHLIGYSNPTKLTFGTACNIIVDKIFAENIGGDMLRGGITLALINGLVIRVVEVLWWNPDCLICRCMKTPERIQSINHSCIANEMHIHMMA